MNGWAQNVVRDPTKIGQIARSARRIAVLGIKTDKHVGQPAYEVPKYMRDTGVEIIPVPVYYPDVTHILGTPVIRNLADVPPPVDMVNVFRKPQDLAQHAEEILKLKPTTVWLQSGISDDTFEEQMARAGIQVVSNRCLMVEHRNAPFNSNL